MKFPLIFLTAFFSSIFLFFPSASLAFDPGGIVGTIGDASKVTTGRAEGLWDLFTAAAITLALLGISAGILEWDSGLSMNLSGFGEIFITTGHVWVLGMVNIFLVLAFVFAALIYILDIQTKIVDNRTMLYLVIVAFVINFSLVFVKFILDFFTIFERGIAESLIVAGIGPSLFAIVVQSGTNFFFSAAVPVMLISTSVKLATVLTPITFMGSDIAKTAFLTFGIVAIYTPIILEIISGLLMSLVFLIYSILFIARYVVIHWLAMLAPLAIVFWAFPQLRHYFTKWITALIIWAAMGTILIFVLGFGLQMRVLVMEGMSGITLISGVGGHFFTPFIGNFFFGIYSIISFLIIKKILPSGVQGAVDLAKKGALVGAAVGGGFLAAGAIKAGGTKVQKTLQKVADKRGTDSFAGRFASKAAQSTQESLDKVANREKEELKGVAKNTKTKQLKEAREKGDVVSQKAIIQSLLEEDRGLSVTEFDSLGYSNLDEVESIVGAEVFNKEMKPLAINQQQNKVKLLEDYNTHRAAGGTLAAFKSIPENQTYQNAIARFGNINDIPAEIIKEKERLQQKMEKATADDLHSAFETNPSFLKSEVARDSLVTRSPADLRIITGNDDRVVSSIIKDGFLNCNTTREYQAQAVKYKNMLDTVNLGDQIDIPFVDKVAGGSQSQGELREFITAINSI